MSKRIYFLANGQGRSGAGDDNPKISPLPSLHQGVNNNDQLTPIFHKMKNHAQRGRTKIDLWMPVPLVLELMLSAPMRELFRVQLVLQEKLQTLQKPAAVSWLVNTGFNCSHFYLLTVPIHFYSKICQ